MLATAINSNKPILRGMLVSISANSSPIIKMHMDIDAIMPAVKRMFLRFCFILLEIGHWLLEISASTSSATGYLEVEPVETYLF